MKTPDYVTKTTRCPQRNKRHFSDLQYHTGADLPTRVQYHKSQAEELLKASYGPL